MVLLDCQKELLNKKPVAYVHGNGLWAERTSMGAWNILQFVLNSKSVDTPKTKELS